QQTVLQKDFPASVREIVMSGCLNRIGWRPFYSKKEKTVAHDNMKKTDICDLADKCYRDLSGGQQQRVLLARALCSARKMLLLDEPVSGLDPKASAEMYESIQRLNSKDGITVIMISHDIPAAVKYANKMLHLGSHKPLFFGSKEEYVKSGIADSFLHEKEDV
ncbi:MAG: ATP-binding cassette domain-containing protein, partial [Clostridia bacterium]|nr:ATP-binding cassette domain-containing protein [Clostridia bacterium]